MITKEEIYDVIPKDILKKVFKYYSLNLYYSVHGVDHWTRVLINGLKISEQNNANKKVIIAFAFFHDSKRERDDEDPEHGLRGSKFLQTFLYKLNMTKDEIKKAMIACEGHTHIIHHEDVDIATCWDADRLDLFRVGIRPESKYLNSDFAKNLDNIKEASDCSWEQRANWVQDLLNDLR